MNELKVIELNLQVALLQSLKAEEAQEQIAFYLNLSFVDSPFAEMHSSKEYKSYTFASLYPLEQDGIYKPGKIYNIKLRTIDVALAQHFKEKAPLMRTKIMQGITANGTYMQFYNPIEKLYSISSALIKTAEGYWKTGGKITFEQYVALLTANAYKKYKFFTSNEVDESQDLFQVVELVNRTPVATQFKGMLMLGDKLDIVVANNAQAQEIAKMLLGTGVLENTSVGFGYVNAKFLK